MPLVVVAYELSCSGLWNLPGPGIEPVSPALAGRFLTTGWLRKSYKLILETNVHAQVEFICMGHNCVIEHSKLIFMNNKILVKRKVIKMA